MMVYLGPFDGGARAELLQSLSALWYSISLSAQCESKLSVCPLSRETDLEHKNLREHTATYAVRNVVVACFEAIETHIFSILGWVVWMGWRVGGIFGQS